VELVQVGVGASDVTARDHAKKNIAKKSKMLTMVGTN